MQRAYKSRRALLVLGIILASCHFALALDPSLDISQYAHTAWKIRDGFTKGNVTALAQTPDGYLWLGTDLGLLRFDGVRAVPWQPPPGEALPHSHIRSLLVARDGRLWIGTLKGLASWKDGKLTTYPELAVEDVDALVEDREGTVWAAGSKPPTGRLCAIHRGSARCDENDGNFGEWVESLYEDSEGNLWVAAETGLWRWKPGPPEHYPLPYPLVDTLQTLVGGDNGAPLVATRGGVEQLVNGKPEPFPLPGAGREINPKQLLRDRNGGLWLGTQHGLWHVHQGRTDLFAQADGLSIDFVGGLFEDREGNIWVSTLDGLDRFREFAVPTISVNQGLSNAGVTAVLAARDGSVWLVSPDGLSRWKDGQITIYRTRSAQVQRREQSMTGNAQSEQKPGGLAAAGGPGSPRGLRTITDSGLPGPVGSIFEDRQGRIWASTRRGLGYMENGRFTLVSADIDQEVYAVAEDRAGDLWISEREHGLFHLRGGSVVERIPWENLGRKDWATASIPGPVEGGLWLGFREGGVGYLKDGQVRASYGAGDGLGQGRVKGLQLDQDGTLWASTEGGLSRLKNGRVSTLTSRNGLPCDTIHWTVEDDAHSFWLYTACGLVRIARPELEAWAADAKRTIQATVFDSSDGVRSHGSVGGYGPHFAKTADGKIWFLPYDGVSVIDPRHLPTNTVPPPVHVEQITADRKTYWQNLLGDAASPVRLPPRVRDLEIDYTALSLVAPEKVQFRYKLAGRDHDWQEAGTRRQAYYTDLVPGHYSFHVAACNNSGVWNEAGDTLDFSIAPAYYQTLWFRFALAAAFLALLWMLYQYRLHQVALEFDMRLEERVGERTRIARELHDTLLQSFHGLMFRFQAARNLLPGSREQAIQTLDDALSRADQAIGESHDAIQNLRTDPVVQGDLAHLLTAMGQELAGSGDANRDSPNVRVTIEGEPRSVSPLLQDEVYRIAREVLRNAFRHARATEIEVEIRYDDRLLRLRLRDNGKGIEPQVLKEGGRAGHWGLPGIRERAERVGARLDLWSEAGAGTEVQLTVPASIAYEPPRNGHGFRLFRKKEES